MSMGYGIIQHYLYCNSLELGVEKGEKKSQWRILDSGLYGCNIQFQVFTIIDQNLLCSSRYHFSMSIGNLSELLLYQATCKENMGLLDIVQNDMEEQNSWIQICVGILLEFCLMVKLVTTEYIISCIFSLYSIELLLYRISCFLAVQMAEQFLFQTILCR